MTPGTPRVSVLTPSYNYARFLPACLESVRKQDAEGQVQHVVVDDGSTDGSWKLLQQVRPDDPVCVRQDNRGLSATLNRALGLADGEWVLWLNSDDFLLPTAVSLLELALARTPDADVVFADAVEVDEDGRLLRLVTQPSFHRRLLRWGYNPFLVPSVFFRRSKAPTGGFDESMQLLMDLDMWTDLTAPPATVVKIDAPTAAVRRHAGQVSARERPSDAAEMRSIAERHGLPALREATSSRPLLRGKVLHGALKVADRGRMRERSMRSRRGTPVDWTTLGMEGLPHALRATTAATRTTRQVRGERA